jgi:hypothetical protein
MTWPIQPGDHVLILISTLSPQQWRQSGQPSDPGDLRPHHLGNSFALPCLAPASQTLAHASQSALVLEGPTEIKLGQDATDFVALAQKVLDELNKILATFNSAVAPAGGGAVTYGSPYVPAAVAATKVKAK